MVLTSWESIKKVCKYYAVRPGIFFWFNIGCILLLGASVVVLVAIVVEVVVVVVVVEVVVVDVIETASVV
jgi:predicted membrane protein